MPNENHLREWLTGLALPIAIFATGFLYSRSKDAADDEQKKVDRVGTLIKSLASPSFTERHLARSYVLYLSQHHQTQEELADLLTKDAEAPATPQDSADSVATVNAIAKQANDNGISNNVNSLPVRVFVQISDETDRPAAAGVASWLQSKGYLVPGIQHVTSGPSQSQIRYANSADSDNAKALSEMLNGQYSHLKVSATSIAPYAVSRGLTVPSRVLELWLSSKPNLATTP